MTRPQLEHVIRAAATIAGDSEIVVIGSQAILGRHPDAPPDLLVSADVDLYPRNHPEKADLIEGSIGELSPFHETYLLERLHQTRLEADRRLRIQQQIEADLAARSL